MLLPWGQRIHIYGIRFTVSEDITINRNASQEQKCFEAYGITVPAAGRPQVEQRDTERTYIILR